MVVEIAPEFDSSALSPPTVGEQDRMAAVVSGDWQLGYGTHFDESPLRGPRAGHCESAGLRLRASGQASRSANPVVGIRSVQHPSAHCPITHTENVPGTTGGRFAPGGLGPNSAVGT